MKISIVTLSLNQQNYLKDALDSVLQQGYPELEYIVVDPGSTDGSRELIQSYANQLSHMIFERDRGAADGLNKGFARATGEIFAFLNADDILLPGSLQRVADFFEQHSDCDVAMGNGFVIDGEGRVQRHVRARSFTVRRYVCGGTNWLQQSTFFRSRAFLNSPGFNVENRTCWDGELFVKMVHQGAKVGYIAADLAGFRIHDSSISGSGRLQQQYEQDSSRIFRDLFGREWDIRDDVQRFFYRSEGLLRHMRTWMQKITKREFA